MCSVWFCSVEISPTQETPGPVSLPGFMVGNELIAVDGSIGFIQCVSTACASIICETGRDRDASAGQKDRFVRSIAPDIIAWGGKKSGECVSSASGGVR